jgi:hypothetical protein
MANTRIENGKLIIELPLAPAPKLSSTGKTFVVAGTGGFAKTEAVIGGKPVSISVNATIPAR